MLWAHYSAPDGFNMYMTGGDPLWINDEESPEYNAPQRADDMMKRIEERAAVYRTPEVFAVFGDDFKYINAHWMFTQLDNMIEYMNANHGDKYYFRYSTPSEYIDAVRKHDVTWPTKQGDMFPYSSTHGGHDFWTGYFTSRANAKAYVRRTSSAMTASSSLLAIMTLGTKNETEISAALEASELMMDAVGILQHHDAVTGTAKQAVADNYNELLFLANAINGEQYNAAVGGIIKGETGLDGVWRQCERTNDTVEACPIQSGKDVYVAVHNPSSIAARSVRIPVPSTNFNATDPFSPGTGFEQQIIQTSDVSNKHEVEAGYTLIVDVEVPPHGIRVIQLTQPDEKTPSVKEA